MVTSRSPDDDLSQNALQIKENDRFYGRLLSKERENPMGISSHRVYYGGAPGEVPFMWESRPGTPKHPASSATLPPLTPPPSYLSKKNPSKKNTKSKHFMIILPRFPLGKLHMPSLLSPSSSFSSRSLSLPSSPSKTTRRGGRSRNSSPRSSFSSKEDEDAAVGSPISTLCVGVGRHRSGGLRGCYSMFTIKNALLSILHSHGSNRDG